ncbi:MAG: terminase family protein [Azoarcus sp.]|jgi:predicted phage terminase large subunit-like protein|nr:terminase family protein [Azoarcus sp.]
MASPKQKTCPACGIERDRSSYIAADERCGLCRSLNTPVPAPTPTLDALGFVASGDPSQGDPSQDELNTFPAVEIDYNSPTVQEMAARVLARRSLLHFIKRFKPKYMAGWVHMDICRRLERFVRDVAAGKEPRLLLMMPVRHGKSEIASRHFAPWVLGQFPDWEFIAASGAQSLALSFSRYIRDLVRDPSYHAVFSGMRLDPGSQAVENWGTTSGGGYLAAGIGTMITGRGAHILLIDDPVRDAEAADSQQQRDGVWEWYVSTAYTRLAPGGGVLGIMTWWNEDDWAGRVQQSMRTGDGDMFEIVKYPAINDQGDEYLLPDDNIIQLPPGSEIPEGSRMTRPFKTALHPERYTLDALLRRKATYYALGQQRWWSALYQQNPTPEEGAYFTRRMFRTYEHEPQRHQANIYQAWDFAITEGEQNDWTVGCTVLQDAHDNIYVLDVTRFRSGDGIDVMSTVVEYARHWNPVLVGVEDGQIWKALESTFHRVCEEKRFYPAHEVLKPFTDKLVRAQPLRGRMQSGKVWFPERAEWYDELRTEFLRFNAGGKHDDQVDALAWAIRLTLSRSAPKVTDAPVAKSWRDKLRYLGQGSGGHMAA